MLRRNLLLSTDSYKASHWLQLPPGTQAIHMYLAARLKDSYTVFFGLQQIIQDYLTTPITLDDIAEAEELLGAHGLPFNKAGWLHILREHGGLMPVHIRAVPEGTVVPSGNALVTVESTDPAAAWIASYLETLLLRAWYPTTVATRSHMCKQVIKGYLQDTADNLDGLPFKLHDFGPRGVSSGESAAIGGMAHLVNFLGTDNLEALVAARRYYDEPMAGFSIPASEHSTITSWGKDREVDAYGNMLQAFGGAGKIFACVSDSYDIDNAVLNLWGGELRQAVIDSGATVVIRPDSGDPISNVSRIAAQLDAKFGSVVNSKGFKVLNHVRIIQGDGIDSPSSIDSILRFLKANGYSADNVAFGMGGGLLQHVNRDTLGFAMKCSAVQVDGAWRDVYKSAPGKASLRGRLDLVTTPDGFATVQLPWTWPDCSASELQTVYRDGQLGDAQTLSQIRDRAAA